MSARLIGVALLFTALCLLSTVISQEQEWEKDESTRLDELHPIVRVFNPEELRMIRDADGVAITPLQLERKLSRAWTMGKRDALELAKNATRVGVGVHIDSILSRDQENELQLTPQQLQEQLNMAYQMGGLHTLNRLVKTARRRLPRIRSAAPEEMRGMRRQQMQLMRMWREQQRQRLRGIREGREEESEMEKQRVNELKGEVGIQQESSDAKISETEKEKAEPFESMEEEEVEEQVLNADNSEAEVEVESPSPASTSVATSSSDFSVQQFFPSPFFPLGIAPFGYWGYSPGFWRRRWWGRGGWGWGRWGRGRWGRFFW